MCMYDDDINNYTLYRKTLFKEFIDFQREVVMKHQIVSSQSWYYLRYRRSACQ